jgi:hypothetical protein
MAHLTSIGAGMFSDMSVASPATDLTAAQITAMNTEALFVAAFATEITAVGGTEAAGTFIRIQNVREFPSLGIPANIVNVPRFGARTSSQVQGQADAPSIELTLNYVAADWAKGATQLLGSMVGDGVVRAFRFAMLNSPPTSFESKSTGLGTVPNSEFYFTGKVEALVYNPQLTDANQATLTISMLSELYGAFTV